MERTFLKLFKKNNRTDITKKLNFSSGVTFIELIVVISIFAIISSVVLFNFSDFSSAIATQNLAHDIALRIKSAQTNAISGKQEGALIANGLVDSTYRPSYGIHFGKTDTTYDSTNEYHFFSFADLNGDHEYNDLGCQPATVTECLELTEITVGGKILSICVNSGTCSAPGNMDSTTLDITFKRPFPDATILSSLDPGPINEAQIILESAKGTQKIITVNKIGQISVN
jgi:prepilin-type N-terminal cleavage/methylation domain-containing protein